AGLIPVCLAYIGDAVPYALRQETVSRFLTGVVLAQTLSGPIGGLFGDHVGWRGVFVLLAACGAVVAASLAVRIRSLPDRRGVASFRRENYVAMAVTPFARQLLIATVVEGALLPGCFPFIAPYLAQHFGLSYGVVGLILAAFGIGAFGYTLYARSLIAHLGESGQILLGYFALHTVMQARATELLPDARSTAVSTFVFLLFLGQAVGALGMGAAIAAFGYRTAFLGDAAGIILLTLWLARFMHRTGQQADGGDALVAKRSRHAP